MALQPFHRRTAAAATVLGLLLASSVGVASARAEEKHGLPLLYASDFSKGADEWEPTDPSAWKVVEVDGQKVYSQFKESNYKPPHRSPWNISLLKDIVVGDFVLEVEAMSTVPAYGHRDMCLFFGYQGPAHLHYVHFANQQDAHANNIFIVNDAPRLKISEKTNAGNVWKDNTWHKLKVVRRVDDGLIECYFDDMETPVMVAHDKTFTWGQVGIGTFDDTGHFRNIRLYGQRVARPESK